MGEYEFGELLLELYDGEGLDAESTDVHEAVDWFHMQMADAADGIDPVVDLVTRILRRVPPQLTALTGRMVHAICREDGSAIVSLPVEEDE